MSDRADSAQFKVAGLTDGRYLPFKGESLIKEDVKVNVDVKDDVDNNE